MIYQIEKSVPRGRIFSFQGSLVHMVKLAVTPSGRKLWSQIKFQLHAFFPPVSNICHGIACPILVHRCQLRMLITKHRVI